MSHNTMLCNINNTAHESKKIPYAESPDQEACIDFSSIFMIFDVIFDELYFLYDIVR